MKAVVLTDQEIDMLLAALAHHPDPEGYDFGPAYELDKEAAEELHAKLSRVRKLRVR